MNKNSTLELRLKILGITREEIERCKNRNQQKGLIRKATRRVLTKKHLHPDDPQRLVSEKEATRTTQEIYNARDGIIQEIDAGRFLIAENKAKSIDSPFIEVVNKNHHNKIMEDLIKNFDKTPRTKEPKRKGNISNMANKFNNGLDSVKDAIYDLKRKLRDRVTEKREERWSNSSKIPLKNIYI